MRALAYAARLLRVREIVHDVGTRAALGERVEVSKSPLTQPRALKSTGTYAHGAHGEVDLAQEEGEPDHQSEH